MRCRMRLVLALMGLLGSELLYAQTQDVLWRVYTRGSQGKRAILWECFEQLQEVKDRSVLATEPPNWSNDPGIRWLLRHRIPTMLAVEVELKGKPEGRYLGALLYLTEAVGNRRLLRQLPALLKRTKTTDSKLQILRVMSDLRDNKSLAALRNFLEEADSTTPDVLVAEAARGLGLSGKEEYLPLLKAASRMVQSPKESLRIMGARYRCGELEMAQHILSLVKDSEAELELRLWAVDFIARNPFRDAVPVLAELAANGRDKQLSASALRALVQVTGYGMPPAEALLKVGGASEQEAAEQGETTAMTLPPEDSKEMSQKERQKLVNNIMHWWQEHREAMPQPLGPITREEALHSTEQSVPR